MKTAFVFRTVGRTHPRFDAVVGRVFILGPDDESCAFRWAPTVSDSDFDFFFPLDRAESAGVPNQVGMDPVAETGTVETIFLRKFRNGQKFSVGTVTVGFARGNVDLVIGPRSSFPPRKCKVKMMSGRPRNRNGIEIF